MIHPDTELQFISPEIGFGVVATKLIPKGTITWALDDLDQEFTPKQVARMTPRMKRMLDHYTYRNNKGNFVLCWDHARFVNHSFRSNCLSTCYDFEFAIRDILPGEQLTDDYGYLNITEPFEGVDEGTDRKIVYPDDLIRMAPEWDRELAQVFPLMTKVAQPLADLLPERIWKKAVKIAEGKQAPDSIGLNYYPDKAVVNGL
jgi:uncharacterized protein